MCLETRLVCRLANSPMRSAIIVAESQGITFGYLTAAALLCIDCYDRCCVVLYLYSCPITCIARSATNPSIKLARY